MSVGYTLLVLDKDGMLIESERLTDERRHDPWAVVQAKRAEYPGCTVTLEPIRKKEPHGK